MVSSFAAHLVQIYFYVNIFLTKLDVLDMMDVLVEDGGSLNEEIGCTLSEDMVVNTFPFSAIVPASLEARNKLLVDENARGIFASFCNFYPAFPTKIVVISFLIKCSFNILKILVTAHLIGKLV